MPLRRIPVRSSRCSIRRGNALAKDDQSSPLPKLRHAMVLRRAASGFAVVARSADDGSETRRPS